MKSMQCLFQDSITGGNKQPWRVHIVILRQNLQCIAITYSRCLQLQHDWRFLKEFCLRITVKSSLSIYVHAWQTHHFIVSYRPTYSYNNNYKATIWQFPVYHKLPAHIYVLLSALFTTIILLAISWLNFILNTFIRTHV